MIEDVFIHNVKSITTKNPEQLNSGNIVVEIVIEDDTNKKFTVNAVFKKQ
jgi:hypothetical protein